MASKLARLDLDWASDVEMLASALESGLLTANAIKLLATRASNSWRAHFAEMSRRLDEESTLQITFTEFKVQLADPRFDFLIELLLANAHFGGIGLVSALHRVAADHRNRAAVRDDVASRIAAIVSVARLGAASPWVMAALLCTRPENLQAYTTDLGPMVLTFGATICAASLALIQRLSKLPNHSRGLAA